MVRGRGRNDFTESDDDNLINFIALGKPEKSGRLGNNLYIVLEKSADQRSWAKRHSWQSWRERYKKHQQWFDFKIKKYQKQQLKEKAQVKRKNPEQNPTINGNNERTADKERSNSNVEKLPRVQGDEPGKGKRDSDMRAIPLATTSTPAPMDILSKPKADRVQSEANGNSLRTREEANYEKNGDEQAAVRVTSVPPPERISSTGSLLPSESETETDSEEEGTSEINDQEELYKELFGISQFSEDGVDEKVLAPSSSNVKLEQYDIYLSSGNIPQPGTIDDEPHIPGSFDGMVNVEATPVLPHAQQPAPNCIMSPRRKSTTSGTTIAPQPTRRPQRLHNKPKRKILPQDDDRNFFGTPSPSPLPANRGPVIPVVSSSQRGQPPTSFEGPYRSSLKRALSNDESWPPKRRKKAADNVDVINRDVAMSNTGNVHSRVETKKHPGPRNISPMRRLIATPNNECAAVPQRTHTLRVDAGDPFIANKPLDKEEPASSPAGNLTPHDRPPRRIDFRQSLNTRGIRRSSVLSSCTSTSSTLRRSVTSFLLPEDQEIVNQVGFPAIMARIAKHYGFDVDVATNAFLATKSIEKTVSVLRHAKEVANSATSALLAELVDQSEGDDVDLLGIEEPQHMLRGRSPSSGRDRSVGRKAKRSSGFRKTTRPSLNFKPQTFDDEVDYPNALSDYSPPRISRAGQFMRLVKQGREEEAVDRERRRASGVFVAQTQVQSYDEDQRQQSLPPIPNSSPTLNSGEPTAVDNFDDDDLQPAVATPVKEKEASIQPEVPDDVSPPVDHHRIFFKRISEGQPTLNKDEDDPTLLKLACEHRDLVMDVTEENADALRDFSQKNNQDLLRLWSLDWARQKIAAM